MKLFKLSNQALFVFFQAATRELLLNRSNSSSANFDQSPSKSQQSTQYDQSQYVQYNNSIHSSAQQLTSSNDGSLSNNPSSLNGQYSLNAFTTSNGNGLEMSQDKTPSQHFYNDSTNYGQQQPAISYQQVQQQIPVQGDFSADQTFQTNSANGASYSSNQENDERMCFNSTNANFMTNNNTTTSTYNMSNGGGYQQQPQDVYTGHQGFGMNDAMSGNVSYDNSNTTANNNSGCDTGGNNYLTQFPVLSSSEFQNPIASTFPTSIEPHMSP